MKISRVGITGIIVFLSIGLLTNCTFYNQIKSRQELVDGASAYKNRQFEEARELFRDAISRDPNGGGKMVLQDDSETDQDNFTVAVGLRRFFGQYGTDWGAVMAASTLGLVSIAKRRYSASGVDGVCAEAPEEEAKCAVGAKRACEEGCAGVQACGADGTWGECETCEQAGARVRADTVDHRTKRRSFLLALRGSAEVGGSEHPDNYRFLAETSYAIGGRLVKLGNDGDTIVVQRDGCLCTASRKSPISLRLFTTLCATNRPPLSSRG